MIHAVSFGAVACASFIIGWWLRGRQMRQEIYRLTERLKSSSSSLGVAVEKQTKNQKETP